MVPVKVISWPIEKELANFETAIADDLSMPHVPKVKGEESDDGDSASEDDASVPEYVMELVVQRTAAKDAKDWEMADSLQAMITGLGFAAKNVKGGDTIVSKV